MKNLKRTVENGRSNRPERDGPPELQWVRDLVERAGVALRAMQLTARDRPQGYKSAMPTPVRSAADIFAALVDATPEQRAEIIADLEAERRARPIVTPDDIAALDQLTLAMFALDREQRIVIVARSMRVKAKWIAEVLGCGRATVYRREEEAHRIIAARLAPPPAGEGDYAGL